MNIYSRFWKYHLQQGAVPILTPPCPGGRLQVNAPGRLGVFIRAKRNDWKTNGQPSPFLSASLRAPAVLSLLFAVSPASVTHVLGTGSCHSGFWS